MSVLSSSVLSEAKAWRARNRQKSWSTTYPHYDLRNKVENWSNGVYRLLFKRVHNTLIYKNLANHNYKKLIVIENLNYNYI